MLHLKPIVEALQYHPHMPAIETDWMAFELSPIDPFADYYTFHHMFDIFVKLASKMVVLLVNKTLQVMYDAMIFLAEIHDLFPKSLYVD